MTHIATQQERTRQTPLIRFRRALFFLLQSNRYSFYTTLDEITLCSIRRDRSNFFVVEEGNHGHPTVGTPVGGGDGGDDAFDGAEGTEEIVKSRGEDEFILRA